MTRVSGKTRTWMFGERALAILGGGARWRLSRRSPGCSPGKAMWSSGDIHDRCCQGGAGDSLCLSRASGTVWQKRKSRWTETEDPEEGILCEKESLKAVSRLKRGIEKVFAGAQGGNLSLAVHGGWAYMSPSLQAHFLSQKPVTRVQGERWGFEFRGRADVFHGLEGPRQRRRRTANAEFRHG